MRTGYRSLIRLCICQSLYKFLRFYCKSCTKPTSAKPGSLEAGEYGLTRGRCFVQGRLEVVAVAMLLSILWCVLGWADCFFVFLHSFSFCERTRPAAGMRPLGLMYFSTCQTSAEVRFSDLIQIYCNRVFAKVRFKIYFFKNCPEGNICGTFKKKGQKCTLSKVGFDQKLRYILFLCFIGLQRTEHLSEEQRLCNGL